MGIPICGACRRPIEERVVTALGKVEKILEDSLNLISSPSVKIQIMGGIACGEKLAEFRKRSAISSIFIKTFGERSDKSSSFSFDR